MVHRVVQSPVLVGRDDILALTERRLAAAPEASGGLLLAAAAGGRGERPWSPPSAREFEVARLVAAGHTNREIAAWAAAVATDGAEA